MFLISRRVREARGGSSVELTQRSFLSRAEEGFGLMLSVFNLARSTRSSRREFCRTRAEEFFISRGGGFWAHAEYAKILLVCRLPFNHSSKPIL